MREMLNLRYHFTFSLYFTRMILQYIAGNVTVTKLFQLTATVLSRIHRNGIMYLFLYLTIHPCIEMSTISSYFIRVAIYSATPNVESKLCM